jgi:bifunctional DNA-binding transcriptional regulator/antitoxin component of YhaV-PrlF toxin-antitoxin module
MPTTIEHIKGAELPPFLQEKFNVKPQQFLKITVEVEEPKRKNKLGEFEIENLGDVILEGLKEIAENKEKGITMLNARDLLNSL